MVFRVAFLALLALCALVCSAQALCRSCHPVHYPELGRCVDCHRGDERTARADIAHFRLIPGSYAHFNLPGSPLLARGRALAQGLGCRRCHVLEGQGNALAANLDRAAKGARAQELAEALRHPALFMPDFRLNEDQVAGLINAIFAGGEANPSNGGELAQVVHFEENRQREDHPFVKHCGGCHRMLSAQQGALGQARVGPNLSGLLSEHYPASFDQGQRWSLQALEKWLKNPRQSRSHARMPPVELPAAEQTQLAEAFGQPASTAQVAEAGDAYSQPQSPNL